ncbi:MAG TPA: helix-turn-helix domain-containing protein [Sphingomonadaceae bacterium]|nr:helix-turn-helix domain-containing protein [Sphingomonadaceae bacterium]
MDDDDVNVRAARARKGSPFLSNAQAAYYIGLHWRTLENMRSKGLGPRYRKHGRFIRYHIDDLDEWSRTNGQRPRPDGGSDA